jgi:nicotinate phosphoribosyltransferase
MGFDIRSRRNLTMLTDFYELTMANGYLRQGMGDTEVVFDMFFRRNPDKGGFAIFAGLEQVIDYLSDLHFSPEDIEFLRSKGIFGEDFLSYLANFKFACDVWAVPEGTPVFPGEPLVTVKGPAIQAQFIETMLLLTLNHQTLIATKASRLVRAAEGRVIFEFGSRRAQGFDGAVYGARAAYIGGCAATACTLSDQYFGVPAVGTMAHSWVQMFDSEYEAFKAYAELYPSGCTLLVDTYNTLQSGIPNAIRVFDEVLAPLGHRPVAIRIDSGDLAYLSKKAREMLDEAGYPDCKIIASNSLDEYIIRELILHDAQLDMFGVGENLITSRSNPVFGGVYKLAAVERDGVMSPRIKISEQADKITTPGHKCLYRLYNPKTGKAIADYITLVDEVVDDTKPLTIFDPKDTWKRKRLDSYKAVKLQQPIFVRGELVYKCPSLPEIQAYCKAQLETLWDELMRFEFPHTYYVDLSKKLYRLKMDMIAAATGLLECENGDTQGS